MECGDGAHQGVPPIPFPPLPPPRTFACPGCANDGVVDPPAFHSQKALLSHRRAKHSFRCDARFYIDSFGVRPVCKTVFSSRFRAIAHLSDPRRTNCTS
eukprot:5545981-Pyramimonas_sp.AAC.1